MIDFNQEEVRQLFNFPENYEIALLIAMGKEDTSKGRMRGYRNPVRKFVTFDSF